MAHDRFNEMLEVVAKCYDTTPEKICERITLALAEGKNSPDAQVRALWDSIPHSGSELSLPDFITYLVETLQQPFQPQ